MQAHTREEDSHTSPSATFPAPFRTIREQALLRPDMFALGQVVKVLRYALLELGVCSFVPERRVNSLRFSLASQTMHAMPHPDSRVRFLSVMLCMSVLSE